MKKRAGILFWITACMLQAQSIYVADPTVFYENDIYYLYGTQGTARQGFPVYVSQDLKNWSVPENVEKGCALLQGPRTFGTQGFWAPQVVKYKDRYYMAYTADEHIAIAEADSPCGPFTQPTVAPVREEGKQIDPFLFFDDDGKIYLYHVRLNGGNSIWVARMTDDLSAIRPETLRQCITATDAWENTEQVEWPIIEGPTVVKRAGRYYLFYSANDFRSIDYAVGYAVSDTPYGPWKKYEKNPLLSRQIIGYNGSGHGDLFCGKDNRWYYVFHTHHSNTEVHERKTLIVPVEFISGEGTGEEIVRCKQKDLFTPVLRN